MSNQLTPYKQRFAQMEKTFSVALPKIAEVFDDPAMARRFQRIALAQMTPQSKLLECDTPSILGCLLESAELGLEPAVAGQCWLVPFKRSSTLIVGYMGFKDLAWRSGQVSSFYADCVHEADQFDYFQGFGQGREPWLEHRRAALDGEDPGDLRASYCAVQTTSGGWMLKVLSKPEVLKRKGNSHTRRDSAWVTHADAMWTKSAVRALYPMLPTTTQSRRALDVDRAADAGKQALAVDPIDFGVDPEMWQESDAAITEAKDITPKLPCGKPCGNTTADEPLSCSLDEGHDGACAP